MICGSLDVTCVLEVFSLMSETAHTSSTSDGGSVDATSVSSTFPVTDRWPATKTRYLLATTTVNHCRCLVLQPPRSWLHRLTECLPEVLARRCGWDLLGLFISGSRHWSVRLHVKSERFPFFPFPFFPLPFFPFPFFPTPAPPPSDGRDVVTTIRRWRHVTCVDTLCYLLYHHVDPEFDANAYVI